MMSYNAVVTELIADIVEERVSQSSRCSILFTGGTTAQKLYCSWADSMPFDMSLIDHYFGDERGVPVCHKDSNYAMMISALYPDGVPSNFKIERMKGDSVELDNEALRYAELLPESVDLALFSVGHDGHIASMFPDSRLLIESTKSVAVVRSAPKPPCERLTITPIVIEKAKNVIVMATGKRKGRVLGQVLRQSRNANSLPVCLTVGSVWVLDELAASGFKEVAPDCLYDTRIVYA